MSEDDLRADLVAVHQDGRAEVVALIEAELQRREWEHEPPDLPLPSPNAPNDSQARSIVAETREPGRPAAIAVYNVNNGSPLPYALPTGVRIWVVTEADRSATTVLLPHEY